MYEDVNSRLRSAAAHIVTDYHDKAAAIERDFQAKEQAATEFYASFKKKDKKKARTPRADDDDMSERRWLR